MEQGEALGKLKAEQAEQDGGYIEKVNLECILPALDGMSTVAALELALVKPDLVSWPEQKPCLPDQLVLEKMDAPSQPNAGFPEVTVKLEQEEVPCGLLKQEPKTFTDISSGEVNG
ncbi:hypothetical protein JD844_013610 [Phrynosoma platyrhinos]|uniref:Prolactin receptor n=1 Tax=Phrynosoma platyrhinos TaxID=52577 RepID=A0ABQ7TL26_PHRPL|nr:hypothetical protein JD844_013610 [Phrynosoma platyrhinos]